MDVALIVVGLVTLGLGVAVFLLMRGLSAARVELTRAEGELASVTADRDRLGSELADARAEREGLEGERDRQSEAVRAMSVTNAQLTERLDAAAKLIEEFKANREQMVQQFEALGSQTLRSNQEALGKFITERLKDADSLSQAELDKRKQAIESMVKPIRETLDKTHEQITQLDERVKASSASNESLKEETARLTRALSRPEIRGQYGEIQLRRVAELAGMTSYCDFSEQVSERDGDGNLLRPDMVVTLPNDRVIVVDAKANISAYIEAVNAADDTERERHMERFSRHTSEQVKKLADKKYWALFERSPEFVVMFVPGDHFIDAALSRNPQLLDMAAQHGVILASPSTLIGLLRAVAVGWREQALTEQAAALFELGKELHDRAATAFEHAGKLGDSIRQSVDRYNKLVGSIDTRMMPTLRRFEDAGAKSTKSLVEPKHVSGELRQLAAGSGELFGDSSPALEH
ncbi:MAG: DNA recombination protein RmuC [Phycisphaerales bacterium]|nr:DNA recombination protein RmuC [Phycisphaerales bacterium]